MKVVIFDPQASDVGHYKYFNEHIVKLLDSENVEIYMADHGGYFYKWYSDLKLDNADLKIINISDSILPRKKIEGQIKNPIKSVLVYEQDKRWYKNIIIEKINSIHGDVVILTSQGSAALYKVFNCNASIVMITHTVKEFLDSTWQTKRGFLKLKLKKRVRLAQRFSNKLSSIIVLEKRISELLNKMGLKTFWIPYMLFSSEDKNISEDLNVLKREFVVSTVGAIYKDKNIEFVLDSLKKNRPVNFKYKITGLPKGKYGQYIKEKVLKLPSNVIEYRFEYLTEEDYADEIRKANFIVIPYSSTRSDQASGVFFDAMKHNRPVITANVEPFKTYIDKYHVGLTFEEGNQESFINTVEKAKKLGTLYFVKSIQKFKEDFSYEIWKNKFIGFLESIISD